MYISLIDENRKHIINLDVLEYNLTKRVFALDTFSAITLANNEYKTAKIAILNDDSGNMKYSCFINSQRLENNKLEIKGLDISILLKNDVILDYTSGGYPTKLSQLIINTLANLSLWIDKDNQAGKIPIHFTIATQEIETEEVFGSLNNKRLKTAAYEFLKPYLKYYGYTIKSMYNTIDEIIEIKIEPVHLLNAQINMNDFTTLLESPDQRLNKVVIVHDNQIKNEYIRTINNEIVDVTNTHLTSNREYPVIMKIYENKTLANAKREAIGDIADSRYVDNITITNLESDVPYDLSTIPLGTLIHIYKDQAEYKILPISEVDEKFQNSHLVKSIKLGYKKTLLTQIIKGE